MTVAEFIERHRNDDVSALALRCGDLSKDELRFALCQIRGWQVASRKVPSWSEKPSILYPSHLSLEQCSSEATALYKASLLPENLRSMVDLTGGMGVDFSFFARKFRSATYVERDPKLCELARKNFKTLGLDYAEVVCSDAESHLSSMKPQDFAFLDPARRDRDGRRTYAMEDCSPNVGTIVKPLLQKVPLVLLKLSPMLDWHKAIGDLPSAEEVHIVSVANECKELLLLLREPTRREDVKVVCVNGSQRFSYTVGEEKAAPNAPEYSDLPLPNSFLYVPNASVMKAGCFGLLCKRFGVRHVGTNSNLFVSSFEIVDFPGRKFRIEAVSSLNKHRLKRLFNGMGYANVSVRNFPMSAQELQKCLGLKDGGDRYVFGTRDFKGSPVVLLCHG